MTDKRYRVALIHPIDPRGVKVGGIETFVRDYINLHPEDMGIMLIGVDGFGDLELGKVHRVTVRGREIDFMPVVHIPDDVSSVPSGGFFKAVLLQLMMGVLRHYAKIRRILKKGRYTLDLRRIELSILPALFGVRSVQMLHDGATKDKAMSSLLKRFWWVKVAAERFSVRQAGAFYCVNQDLTDRLKATYPRHAHKLGTLPTWANPNIFRRRPFRMDGPINVIFTGRLDLFKRPDLMFATIAEAHKLSDQVRFHYVGDGDPEAFPEFAPIRDITTRHGRKTSEEIAELLGDMHICILTSDFEGMPRVVMESLTVGRPVVALHLPQLEVVVRDGVSGYLIPRGEEQTRLHARRLIDTYRAIETGEITPDGVAALVEPFGAATLLGKLWRDHRVLQGLETRAA
ncbi:glycosyltransferase family 4 protein [Sphingomonas sp.]|uniref:glycosyltransferase family 4 protein n=1 Tax=Sphingomonas sp. TaxID=28214 RepID=UPI0031E4724B